YMRSNARSRGSPDSCVATNDKRRKAPGGYGPAWSLGRRFGALAVRDVDRPAERREAGLLDRLGERRVRGHPVRNGLDRGFGVERDDTGFDEGGDVRADHHDAEQLAV